MYVPKLGAPTLIKSLPPCTECLEGVALILHDVSAAVVVVIKQQYISAKLNDEGHTNIVLWQIRKQG